MENNILIFIIVDAAVTIFFFRKITKGYFFLKEVISWESTEGKIHDLIQVKRRDKLFYKPVVQFKTPDNKTVQFKSTRVKENTFSMNEKVEVLYNPSHPYEAIIKGYENIQYKEGITGVTALIIFNIAAGIIYYFTIYL
ncbi:MAG TPA: DUF3592 domain-containing protein [Cytophagaceae bacterium]|jgi:hypothetical protein|nr:DUF3592 domain-containing protein [Cytophagaceae bacterium]